MPAPGIYTKISGAWHQALTTAPSTKISGSWHSATQILTKISGVWMIVADYTTPSGTPPSPSIALVERPGSSHAGVSWTPISDPTDVRYWYDVVVQWYRNGSLGQTNVVAQGVGADSSPSSAVWSVGDSVSCIINYKAHVALSNVGPTWSSGSVTLDAGSGGGG